ncbi:MAG: hypothetical protein A2315_00375 [Ignavibacteria bacterium RIFOXYB2_FULL_35_12]|nr:MAG: hypothetical protein A2058_12990 [Ignavibacteria bacterium GWA2_36_19]OGU53172.1 MAG: hypothetical protein A2006_07935 [Ignavibacteria bacterium GWC2_35_8]OGU61188.1 MAG: hypothetical protein A2X60_15095 [Ignavibacteria bacterium GWF2_35_20]OGU80881.1 MAG: hypothetical protein A2254_05500 [Ignavibacteria bacterium RIFOXYA2_FULL_35_9]OGU86969.1 MAG: hypothetical protein A3K31_00340 [Ignavibacteria bacterium RIFOXYA12_FULL_35_25]OGU94389.1 MAG: hypothetical protein A2347_12570 [Ignavibac
MQDADIRKLLHPYLERKNRKYKDTIIVDELDLCSGLSRIDIAVINGIIHGYEIKSEEDTLNRLPNQISYYNKSLEKITIATNKSHIKKIDKFVPEWWGLILITDKDKQKRIIELRQARTNPLLNNLSLLQILWKNELISVSNKYNIKISCQSNKRKLRESIANCLDTSILSQEVRTALKSRQNWRS